MNKSGWNRLTLIGFLLAVVAGMMILIIRFHVFDRLMLMDRQWQFVQTQQSFLTQTQLSTEQGDLSNPDIDKTNLNRLHQGCFSGVDCVPPIDHPEFVSSHSAAKFMKDDDLVIGVAFDNSQKEDDYVKAYPIKILNWHEVVNDFVNEIPIVVTYSPLSMTPRVYERMFDGKAFEFGVSDKVLNSDTVLYDRQTKSLWSQFDGSALAGPNRDQKLTVYPLQLVRWADWVKKYPKTVVLSENTGYARPYDSYPYSDYQKNTDIYFPLENTDNRRQPKEVVFGIVVGDQQRVYPELELEKALPNGGTLIDNFAGKKLNVSYNKRTLTVVDAQTNQEIPSAVSYYFTWSAFYPNSEIFQASQS